MLINMLIGACSIEVRVRVMVELRIVLLHLVLRVGIGGEAER